MLPYVVQILIVICVQLWAITLPVAIGAAVVGYTARPVREIFYLVGLGFVLYFGAIPAAGFAPAALTDREGLAYMMMGFEMLFLPLFGIVIFLPWLLGKLARKIFARSTPSNQTGA